MGEAYCHTITAMATVIFALCIRLFYPSKPKATEVLQRDGARTDAMTLNRVLRRLDSGKVWERREQLRRQIRCGFADYGERFRSPYSDGKVIL